MKINVLLSTYNGEKYLAAQLDSLLSQDLKPSKIIVRDDGSTDETLLIIKNYQKKNKIIELHEGENKKPARSFFDLINHTSKADYYALCDQDDVWFKDKLSSAVNVLEKEDNKKPLLYCSRYTLTDENLNPIENNISSLYQYTDFAHSLLYQTAPGCTFVFNDAARKKIIEYDIEKEYVMIHDSIIHKVVALFGKVILDNNSHIYYRQHGNNEIGLNGNHLMTFIERIKHFTTGRIRNTRSEIAKAFLNVYGSQCDKDKEELIRVVAEYRKNPAYKKRLLTDNRFKVEGLNYLFFRILVLVNYI